MTMQNFWRDMRIDNRRVVIRDYGVISNLWFLFPQGDGPRGAFTTFADLAPNLKTRDTIILSGVLREQAVAPLGVYDVTILGAANTPRQATSSGTPTGGGATWLAPTSPVASTALLRLRQSGWSINDVFMSAADDGACIELNRNEDTTNPDASHAAFTGCVFGGGLYGIQDIGGNADIRLNNNVFQNFTGSSAYAIRNTSTSIANPLQWQMVNNLFRNNKNHVVVPMSQAHIQGNDFGIVGNTITTVIALSLTGGLNNTVVENYFNRPLNTSPNATLYVGGTNDLWYQNFGTDAVFYGVPDNS